MKALILIMLAVLATLGIILFQYGRTKNRKKLFISLFTFSMIIALAIMGNVARQVMLIYWAHTMLTVVSWGGLLLYLIRDRYYWWVIFSPVVTIGLFLLLELLTGSSHEIG